MSAQGNKGSAILAHFIIEDTAALMAKLGTRQSTSVYRGEWGYRMCSEAFKDKVRLQLHSKNFDLKQLCISFICKTLKCKAGFILKFKVVCIAK